MKILLLSFYYPPDIGPGPIRAKSIVDALIEVGGSSVEIDVMTTQPNRYQTLEISASAHEIVGNLRIRRFSVPRHKSGMFDQAMAFAKFAFSVSRFLENKRWDVVVSTSSRLMTAALGAWIARQSRAKLYLDIRDLFTDTMEDLLSKSPVRGLMPVFYWLERKTFLAANKLNIVSPGFVPHMREIAADLRLSLFTNGIDREFLNEDFTTKTRNAIPLVLYAGNIGDGQGLHHIIPEVALALHEEVEFRLIGDGGKRRLLERYLDEKSICNVKILNPIPRTKLVIEYRNADILFLHLNDFKAFRKVLPSKIFEYAATRKPILAGVSGYAAEFLQTQVPGVQVFDPCDPVAMLDALKKLRDGPRIINRDRFCSIYMRDRLMRDMASDILSLN